MNIFLLHMIPAICAIYHCNKHCIKQILESAQILCSVHYMTNSSYIPSYKLTHKNHPCSIWARKSLSNYKWLVELGLELCKEYTYRYNKVHKCQQYIELLKENLPPIEDIGFTAPAQAMPDTYKDEDAVQAYRDYYFFEKSHIHQWKKREVPDWLIEMRNYFE